MTLIEAMLIGLLIVWFVFMVILFYGAFFISDDD